MAVQTSSQSPTLFGMTYKTLSLSTLVVQNSVLILVMHYSRIMPLIDGRRYLPSTAVLVSEILKLSISLTMALYDTALQQPAAPVTTLFSDLFGAIFSGDCWKLAIPATLYTLQNTLQYLAASNLNASTFQITYQLKIMTTAIFSVLLLGRSLSIRKWFSLIILAIGVSIMQLPGSSLSEDWDAFRDGAQLNYWSPKTLFPRSKEVRAVLGRRAADTLTRRSASYQGIDEDFAMNNPHINRTLGLVAVIIACISSGLAGVYFEKLLKDHGNKAVRSTSRKPIGLWVRNVQLSFCSLFPALFLGVVWKDGDDISRHGFWAGYNWVVCLTIALQASGGIFVALVIKYANNIAKNFATSISIVIGFVASFFFFDLSISFEYFLGTFVVILATWLYNAAEAPAGPSVIVEDYEKQAPARNEQSYFDLFGGNTPSVSRNNSRPGTPRGREEGFTSSRNASPEKSHFRLKKNLDVKRES